jgi:hypothetical protein
MNKSYEEWWRIHNLAATEYINSEWSREHLFGVTKKRKKLFSQVMGSVLDVAGIFHSITALPAKAN